MAYLDRSDSRTQPAPSEATAYLSVQRVRVWYLLLVIVFGIFFVRLFYLQVIRYGHYKNAALSDQLKQYSIPASRGAIYAQDGGRTLPIVLNEKLYTLYADPQFVKDPAKLAGDVQQAIGGKAGDYEQVIKDGKRDKLRYVILAKKLGEDKRKRITALERPGLGTQRQDYRTYPQGTLASQLLGFVDAEGKGKYGLEQALNKELGGQAGELKAITDVRGVPLAANPGNIERAAVPGKNLLLTIDVAMQKQLETILAEGAKQAKSDRASAVIMEAKTGAIKAMANVPTYDPAKYAEVQDGSVFSNDAVATPIEVGSVMKPLTTAAALDKGAIRADQTYADPAKYKVDDFTITNIEEDGPAGTRSIRDILNLSLNTGATWELMQMGGGKINTTARNTWYQYMTDRYRFGKETGIEQGYESPGYVPKPADNGAGINLTYANTTFGQAMTATPLQMAAAYAAVFNGGTYYQPHLVAGTVDGLGNVTAAKPKVLGRNVVKGQVTRDLIPMMQYTIDRHNPVPKFDQDRYTVGGKTGTAQIAKPDGGYEEREFNGTYTGFVGGSEPQYVIVVFVTRPKVAGYAGTQAAQPVFVNLAHMLINNSYVAAKN